MMQLVFLFLCSESREAKRGEIKAPLNFSLFGKDATVGRFESFLALDPTVFVLPNADGFSGKAWMKMPHISYEIPEWNETPRWLSLDVGALGAYPLNLARTNHGTPFAIAQKTPPQQGGLELIASVETNVPQSEWNLEGELTELQLVSETPLLPVWSHMDLLSETLVQVAVSGEGSVVSARLLARSGLDSADAHAVRVVRQMQFHPLENQSLVWGNVAFRWEIAPLALTNNNETILRNGS